MKAGTAASERERGFALLIVLWTMVLLALVVGGIAASGHSRSALADNLRNGAIAEAAADGAVSVALFHYLISGPGHWPADGVAHRLAVGAAVVTVRATSLAGKVNPNTAPKALLVALLRRLGANPDAAMHLAAAIVDWRSPGPASSQGGAKLAQYRAAGRAFGPPGGPFRNRREVGFVLGMTPQLLARLKPYLSVYPMGGVDPALAAGTVRAALADASGGVIRPFVAPEVATVLVTADAESSRNARFTRRAVFDVDRARHSFRTLDWQEGSD